MSRLIHKLIWVVIAAPLIYLALSWNKIPESIAVHFDITGTADRFGSKKELLVMSIILSVINLALYILFSNLHRIDKKYTAENKQRLASMSLATALFISVLLFMTINNGVRGLVKFDMRFIMVAVGLLFAVIGNYMTNIKPNYVAGFRVKWTLNNEENWKKTHLLAGRLWFAGGLLIALICLLIKPLAGLVVFFTILLIIILVPGIYSYRLYRKTNSH